MYRFLGFLDPLRAPWFRYELLGSAGSGYPNEEKLIPEGVKIRDQKSEIDLVCNFRFSSCSYYLLVELIFSHIQLQATRPQMHRHQCKYSPFQFCSDHFHDHTILIVQNLLVLHSALHQATHYWLSHLCESQLVPTPHVIFEIRNFPLYTLPNPPIPITYVIALIATIRNASPVGETIRIESRSLSIHLKAPSQNIMRCSHGTR
ncbi:hypothetical protein IEQ34_009371 [Dendrobium chrysotoxum]|uniref:Uncharacterized protein n=1 Tax=Dendrobium chrysotoxum TaxID=161865 RepID=A0AAV7H079_DENCH|nr:hypothetical protein IEQ34_009371 [Dendrobium chrysotoxum]